MSQMPVTINGNLIADPEFRTFEDTGSTLCKIRVATSRRYRTEEKDPKGAPIWKDTDNLYVDVECWGQLAVNVGASLRKGFPVVVCGYLITDVWEKELEENGAKKTEARYTTKLKATRVGFELSNFQVSSLRSSAAGNTLEGQEPVTLQSAEDLQMAQATRGDAVAPF
ncbi:single-stranded DNA-binding protein [Corynebacterium sp.]|uniref:single-stranded DNA-binding protein n=1 Tax=Corynebacterium sp. TaxID=1720 RepID=UPI002A908AC9|nr:single-stranded DNA-binding protein [Corynebacterium sp.]MDY5786290.1 single-stranded DNA-binding protein [Corynebacterium sp.]